MKRSLYLMGSTLLISSLSMAAVTQTSVVFNSPSDKTQNEYGDTQMFQNISLETKNFQVDEFWGKFKFGDSSSSTPASTYDISTNANVKVTVELSFACQDGGLDENGCSSQKPFLINEGLLDNPDMQLDSSGDYLPEDEYRIPFDSSLNYDSSNDDAFYALDMFRDGIYYKDPELTGETQEPKNFFGFLKALFEDYFSKDVDTYTSGDASPELRNRYIANITFGAQKEYRVKYSGVLDTAEINKANINKKVSLLDYNSLIIETTTGCDGLFFSYDPDSLTCKARNYFGLSNFMPFVNNSPSQKVKSDSVVEDTETTLLALAGKLDKINYLEQKIEIDSDSGKKTVLQEIFKPVTFMASSMFRFFFGNNSRNLTEIVSAEFTFDNPMPLAFIETDGNIVKKFRQFYLMAIESIYGTEVESCRVKDTKGLFGWRSSYQTFTKEVPTITKFDMEAGGFLNFLSSTPDYSELNFAEERHRSFGDWGDHDVVTVTTDDWLDWCKRNQGRQQKGLFGRIFTSFSTAISYVLNGPARNTTYDSQLDALLKDENYSVDEYKETIHKGLILHLKSTNSDVLTPGVKGTSTKIKIMKTSKGKH
ncbi:hypothetical protein JHD47_09170 [Sulfurimonas sp. SAG-AH-194-L11]|nr:hypothetical protein [Sulfurimonas sp. SAG-AH-194-L11]MDF1877984.1 hypothetical protein [Sulfurimonas sp. SAG-AH-194-L11]